MNETYVTFTGWLGTDVTVREAGGQHVASFRVGSTPRRFKDGEWHNGATVWYQVKAWRRLATHAAQSLRRGDPVVVHGRLTADVWTREDGVSVTQYVVVATSLGHDLNHGTSLYTKPVDEPDRPAPTVEPPAMAAAGSSADSPGVATEDGEVRPDAA